MILEPWFERIHQKWDHTMGVLKVNGGLGPHKGTVVKSWNKWHPIIIPLFPMDEWFI
jgi:hypothetical protein